MDPMLSGILRVATTSFTKLASRNRSICILVDSLIFTLSAIKCKS